MIIVSFVKIDLPVWLVVSKKFVMLSLKISQKADPRCLLLLNRCELNEAYPRYEGQSAVSNVQVRNCERENRTVVQRRIVRYRTILYEPVCCYRIPHNPNPIFISLSVSGDGASVLKDSETAVH